MSFDEVLHAEMLPVLPRIHSVLAEWGAVSEQVHGIEGGQVFADVCNAVGIVITAREPVLEQEASFPEIDAFRSTPGDRTTWHVLADALVERGDPIGAHIHNTLELERLAPDSLGSRS